MRGKRVSTADYLRGFLEGAKASRQGTTAIEKALDRYWLYYSGYVLLPGEGTIRRKTMTEWQEIRGEFVQQIIGHNRLRESG
jgi:hypothetical protein